MSFANKIRSKQDKMGQNLGLKYSQITVYHPAPRELGPHINPFKYITSHHYSQCTIHSLKII